MTQAQWVNAGLFFIWPALFALGFFLFHYLIQRLPAHTRLAHKQFAQQSVEKVELQNPGMIGTAKKALALVEVASLCDDYGLPHPRPKAMDTHIESAVYRLKNAGARP
jgi:hypothetical protein